MCACFVLGSSFYSEADLKKLFSSIHKVEFNSDNSQILALLSKDGERVKLVENVRVTDEVENWL